MPARELLLRLIIAFGVVIVLGAGSIAAIQIASAELADRAETIETELASESRAAKAALEQAAVDMCERIKQDRIDNARAWTEVERYMEEISQTASTEQIRHQAADTRVKVGESANQLRSRLYFCEPLILDGKGIIDNRALREAQGNL